MKKVVLVLVCMFCIAMGLFASGKQDEGDTQGTNTPSTPSSGEIFEKTASLDCGCYEWRIIKNEPNQIIVVDAGYYYCDDHSWTELPFDCGCKSKKNKKGVIVDLSHCSNYPYCVHGGKTRPDTTDPTISITYKVTGGQQASFTEESWYKSVDLTITVCDNIYVSNLYLSIDNGSESTLKISSGSNAQKVYHYTVNTDGSHTLVFKAVDSSNNIAQKKVTIRIDTQVPTINFTNATSSWVKSKILDVTISDNPKGSGISSYTISDTKNTRAQLSKNQYTLNNTEGDHLITVNAVDKAGNSTSHKTHVYIDHTPPEIQQLYVYYTLNQANQITGYTVDAVVKDQESLSGVKSVNIDGTSFQASQNNKYMKNCSILDKDNRGANKTITTVATDNADNETTSDIEVFIPAERHIVAEPNRIRLWNINDTYEIVTIQRAFIVNGNKINEENFSDYFDESLREEWYSLQEQIITNADLSTDKGVYYFIERKLGSFGHKDIQYTIKVKVKNPYPLSDEYCEEIYRCQLTNPINHKANITLRLQGSNSYVILDPTQPITAGTISNLQLDSDGAVRLLFKMEDEDAEPYHVKLRTIPYAEKDGFSIGIPVEGFEADFISEKCKSTINGKTYIHPDEDGWYAFDNRLFLPFNHSQVYLLEWDEGFEQKNYVSCETEMIPLKAEPTNLGGFTLGVDESALYNANGITATVHHEFELSINEQDPSDITNITWDFGADSTSVRTEKLLSSNGYSVVYGQNEDRSGNTSEYILTLTVMHKNGMEKTVPLPVFIEDTRCGKLLGNETWRGQHLLLGEVIVPSGYEIILEGNQINPNNETEILCYGSSRQNEKGKLTIEKGGAVFISTDLSFQEAKNTQSQGFVAVEESDEKLMWAGIEVSGSLTSEGSSLVSIIGAQRGLILRGGGIINLANITIKDCLCGLHIIGGNTGAKLTLTEGTITQNSEYGVKIETDSSGSNNNDLTFNKVVITNNGRDSYMNGKFNVINGGE